jgi:hypothetical protein
MPERAETAHDHPQARLERALIEEFLQARGCSLSNIDLRPVDERRRLLVQAAQYAAGRLAEIDARAAFVHEIHAPAVDGVKPPRQR